MGSRATFRPVDKSAHCQIVPFAFRTALGVGSFE